MSRAKFMAAAIVAVLAIGAVGTASASAAEWKVGGSTFTGKKTINKATKTIENYTLTAAGVTITCTGLEVAGGFIEEPATNGAEHLVFTGCKASGVCTVATTLTTNAVKSTATAGSPVKILFEPTSGTNFITIEFTGAECSLKGKKETTGKVTCTAPGAATSQVEQELACNSTGELKLGTNAATFKGKGDLTLEGDPSWAFS
jgi:hypothetical protein